MCSQAARALQRQRAFAHVNGGLSESAGLDGSIDSFEQARFDAEAVRSLFGRLEISDEIWCRLEGDFGKLLNVVAGQTHRIDEHRSKASSRRYRTRQETRELLATV